MNLTIRSVSLRVEPAQRHDLNINKDCVEDLDTFHCLENVEIIADLE